MIMLLIAATACGCAPTQQSLLASGGSSDFAAMDAIQQEYGVGDPDETVRIPVGDQVKPFKVWLSKTGQKIMVQNGASADIAAAGFVRGLSAGIIDAGAPDIAPYQKAALAVLDAKRGPGCVLSNSRVITRIGYQWDYACEPPGAGLPSSRKKPG